MAEKRYPFIIAYGKSVGSNDGYIRDMVKRAAAENAPADTFGFAPDGSPQRASKTSSTLRAELEGAVARGVQLPDAKTCSKCGEDAESVCRDGFCPDCQYLEMCDHEG